mgnify:CR=1 FL=1
MFRMLDEDSPISKEDLLQFEEILGKKLPEANEGLLYSSTTEVNPK